MEEGKNKFHALQLFTDTFIAETVHLSNDQVGIYIRLLCFASSSKYRSPGGVGISEKILFKRVLLHNLQSVLRKKVIMKVLLKIGIN